MVRFAAPQHRGQVIDEVPESGSMSKDSVIRAGVIVTRRGLYPIFHELETSWSGYSQNDDSMNRETLDISFQLLRLC